MNNQVQKLTFQNVIMSIGVLPSSYVDSMSYYETLLWLCNYLENTVIPTVNNNGQAVEELQSAYQQLQDYVNHYFDNLDVQEEINNKLDQMAEDGSLTELIKEYVDPIYQAYEQNIRNYLLAESQTNLNFRITVNDQIESISDRVNIATSGSPKGVYDTVSSLETADPDHDSIYLVTADGKWYYYDTNDGWTAGGIYQATALSNADEDRIETLNKETLIVQPPFTNQGYINSTGVYTSNASYSCTDYIDVEKYNKIRYKAILYNPNYVVAYYDSTQAFVSASSIVGSGSVDYDVITIPAGVKYVRISNYQTIEANPFAYLYNDESLEFNYNYTKDVLSNYDEIKANLSEIIPTFSKDGEYIAANGYYKSTSNVKATDFIAIKGFNKIDYKLSLASANYIVAYYDKNKDFISTSSINGAGSASTNTVTIPDEAYYVVFSNYYNNNPTPYVRIYKTDSLYSKIIANKSILKGKKIGYLGDSITNGYLATTPFRTIITNNTGSTQYNYGINSSTLSDYNGGSNPVVDRYEDMDNDLDYICVLIGTNDLAPMGDEDSTNTETFYGALNTLIEGLINKYTDRKIMFMTLLPRRSANLTNKNNAIKNRCAYYSIPCFDLFSYSNMNPNVDSVNTELFANNDGLHPNDKGHQMLANKIQKWLESI